MSGVCVVESDSLGATRQDRHYELQGDRFCAVENKISGSRWRAWGLVRATFLPIGYPASVSAEYTEYQFWDTVQALCSYLRGVLATRALFEGVGVGDEAATAAAATVQWLLKDGCGMLGGLLFGSACGGLFDADVKSWRLFADLINNVGLTLDMLAPLAGREKFIWVVCLATVCKAMCGVSAGATKAALTHHFAKNNNSADVQAKESAQETAVTLVGLVLGGYFATVADQSPALTWASFVALTAFHMFANFSGVRCLRIPTINWSRLDILWSRYQSGRKGPALAVEAVAKSEPLVSPLWRTWRRGVEMGVRWDRCVRDKTDYKWMRALFSKEKYMLRLDGDRTSRIFITMLQGATAEDQLKAATHVTAVRRMERGAEKDGDEGARAMVEAAYARVAQQFEGFKSELISQRWDLTRFVMACGSVRCAVVEKRRRSKRLLAEKR